MPVRESSKSRSKKGRVKRILKRALVLGGIMSFLLVAGGLMVWIPIYRQAVTDASEIDSKLVVHSADPSTIVASDGTVIYRIAMQRREVIDIMTLPKYVRDAMVAAEDRRFYTHTGVDVTGLFRIAFLAVRDRHASQGASTIEMQLAKIMVNGDARSLQRKLKDIATAQQIERLKTKEQILNLYMNAVYFGQGAWGIEAAAETYFGKHASKLDIAEAAMLARCVRHPSKENPVKDPEGSIVHRHYVLDVMHQEGWIDDEQFLKADAETPKIDRYTYQGVRWVDNDAGYFVDHVLSVFHEDYPSIDLQEGGYRIETTLNMKLQKTAIRSVAQTLKEHRRQGVNDAAIIVIDDHGRILAEVGGPGYARNKWNVITHSPLQPGSSFKPFVYATAFKEGAVHMGESISNEPIYEDRYGTPWNPKNNGHEHVGGYVGLDTAFANSINLPAIHTLQKVGAEKVVGVARDTFGFNKSYIPPFESIAIGTCQVYPLEMARAYSVFMLRGDRVDPYPIDRIDAPDGQPLKVYEPAKVSTGFDPNICDNIDQLMRGVVEYGTGTAAGVVPDARGKTGTTQDAKDAWFCGYSDNVLGVSWVGNMQIVKGKATQLPMSRTVFGGTVTAGMWAQVLQKAHELKLCHAPVVPVDRVAEREKPRVKSEPANSVTVDKSDDTPAPTDKPEDQTDDQQTPPDQDPPKPKTRAKPRKSDDQKQADVDSTANSSNDQDAPKARVSDTRKSSDDDDDSNYVTVQICADTGMKASKYCPETVSRRFRKGTEPTHICRLHTGN